ncbi:MAG: glycosyltransferase [archaeon]|nr:glycosyltransferase [archaeon]
MGKNFKEISVIVPVYKDDARLKNNLPKIRKYLEKNFTRFEIILALDPPAGNVEKIARNIYPKTKVIINPKRKGKGYSVKEGMLKAGFDPVLFMDIDLSTPVQYIETLMPHLKDSHIVIASRNMPESKIKKRQPGLRNILGKIYPYMVRMMVIDDIKDTQCGFKLFRKEAIEPVFSKQRINGFAFDTEILFIAKKHGYKIKEIPVEWSNSTGSKLHILKDPFRMQAGLGSIILNDRRGSYDRE